jgi:hypothetical protein
LMGGNVDCVFATLEGGESCPVGSERNLKGDWSTEGLAAWDAVALVSGFGNWNSPAPGVDCFASG